MKRPIKFALFGAAVGISVALVLANMASYESLSPLLILTLWPTAIFGLGATGWSDGAFFHVFQGLLVFGGTGSYMQPLSTSSDCSEQARGETTRLLLTYKLPPSLRLRKLRAETSLRW